MKRLFDVIISILALPFLVPLGMVLAILVRINLGSPVFFIQERPGLKGRPFNLIKFRSMKNSFSNSGKPLPDVERLSRLGLFLRASSLDELPEFLNVLKGDMSLVGPRPLLMEYLGLYSQEQSRRHDVLPGITGWAQVNGRNNLSWDEKFKLDVWYIENRSLWLDCKILFLTIRKIVAKDGISQPGCATAEKFTGAVADDEK